MSSRCYSDITVNYVQRFPLRWPDNLRSAVEKRAEKHFRSLNNEIVVLLKLGLANMTEETQALSAADKIIDQVKKNKRPTGNI
ncbi:MAG TPA: Arc family DNA-binding protein [Dehalococcoidia bacterium]|nr:Arc family DNA-binding protein [Dehalococcoidia bacterium]